jgi:hypothetical protein
MTSIPCNNAPAARFATYAETFIQQFHCSACATLLLAFVYGPKTLHVLDAEAK